jgi:hypothetical protein
MSYQQDLEAQQRRFAEGHLRRALAAVAAAEAKAAARAAKSTRKRLKTKRHKGA